MKIYLENNFPYLGICVGMQILSDVGYEDKTTKGLGIIHGEIKKFEKKNLIIPHMLSTSAFTIFSSLIPPKKEAVVVMLMYVYT